MVISSSSRILEATRALRVRSDLFMDLNRQLFPLIRYHNPKVEISTLPSEIDGVCTELEFNDGSTKRLDDMGSYHILMQGILDADREKAIEILSARQASGG
jgi:hypothetical protein